MARTWRRVSRGGGREQLQEVQRRPLGGEQRARVGRRCRRPRCRRPCRRPRRSAIRSRASASSACMHASNQSRPHSTAASRTRTRAVHAAAPAGRAGRSSRRVPCPRAARRACCARAPAPASRCRSNGRASPLLRPRRGAARIRAAAARSLSGLRGHEVEHALDAAQRPAAHRLGHVDLAAAASRRQAITPCSAFIAIHGQCAQLLQVALLPAVGASISVLPGASWRMRWNMPLSVATMYSCARRRRPPPSAAARSSRPRRPARPRSRATRGAPAPCALRMLLAQQLELEALELVVHDAGAVPHQHVGAGLLAGCSGRGGGRAPTGSSRPASLQVLDDGQRAGAGHHPVGARLHRGAGVGIDDDRAVGVRVAERGELVGRAAEVERAGGVEVGHQHALVAATGSSPSRP